MVKEWVVRVLLVDVFVLLVRGAVATRPEDGLPRAVTLARTALLVIAAVSIGFNDDDAHTRAAQRKMLGLLPPARTVKTRSGAFF